MRKSIEKAITRTKFTSRGGGIEINLSRFGYKGEKMSAYQNYLGGGMLGSIANDSTIPNWRDYPQLVKIAKKLRELYAERTDQELYETDGLPVSAY